jgi:hypothetical protein
LKMFDPRKKRILSKLKESFNEKKLFRMCK